MAAQNLPPLPDLSFLPGMPEPAAADDLPVAGVPIIVEPTLPGKGDAKSRHWVEKKSQSYTKPMLAKPRVEHSPNSSQANTAPIASTITKTAAQKSSPLAAAPKPAMPLQQIPQSVEGRQQMARGMVAEARKLLGAGRIDDAEKIVIAVRELAVDFGRFGESPQSLEADIIKARRRAKGDSLPPVFEGF